MKSASSLTQVLLACCNCAFFLSPQTFCSFAETILICFICESNMLHAQNVYKRRIINYHLLKRNAKYTYTFEKQSFIFLSQYKRLMEILLYIYIYIVFTLLSHAIINQSSCLAFDLSEFDLRPLTRNV